MKYYLKSKPSPLGNYIFIGNRYVVFIYYCYLFSIILMAFIIADKSL